MPPALAERVFDPFFTTKGQEGTGLGLAMVYATMQRHGGSVTLSTAEGEGTCSASPSRPRLVERSGGGPACSLQSLRSMDPLYTPSSRELSDKRRALAPDAEHAFREFSKRVFADGALSTKVKNLIAVAAAHVTQCPYCIRGHTKAALRYGATEEEIMEAIWVAAEMRAGAAFAHSTLALDTMREHEHATLVHEQAESQGEAGQNI